MSHNGTWDFVEAAYSMMQHIGDKWVVGGSVVAGLLSLLLLAYLYLWTWSFERMRDLTCPLPLPPGTMGYPVIGETLEFVRKTIVDRHLDSWCQMSCAEGSLLGYQACLKLTLDFSLEIILGQSTERGVDESLRQSALQFLNNLFTLPFAIPGFGMWKGLRARERLLQEIRHTLHRTEERSDSDFHSIVELMQVHPGLSGQQQLIEDNALQMFFASYSSTSGALCNAMMCMGRSPESLSKVEEELEEAGLMQDPCKALTYDVLERLHYVHSFNSEVLRLFPSAGAVFRKASRTLQIGGYQIPKDWVVACAIRETQQTSQLFQDPQVFLPERWLHISPEQKKRSYREYMPFGTGTHVCSGKRLMKLLQALFLVQMTRRYRIQVRNPYATMAYLPVAKPKDDLPFTITSRVSLVQ